MQTLLIKRVWRELKENFLRYLALFLLIVLGMYIIVALVGAAEMVIRNVENGQEINCLEDGQFSVFVPLNEEEIALIEETGVTLETSFFMDYHVNSLVEGASEGDDFWGGASDGDVSMGNDSSGASSEEIVSTLRIYKERQNINLFSLSEGEELSGEGQILLEQHYANANGYEYGDTIKVGNQEFTIVGFGSTPDYDVVYENMSDSSGDSTLFGTGFVVEQDYDALREEGSCFKAEEYCYSYLLNDSLTDDELKELIQSFELDRSLVTDTYFLEMIDEAEETKTDFTEGIDELVDGSETLSDSLLEIVANTDTLREATDSLWDAMLENANSSIEEAGISVVLQSETFEEQLEEIMNSPVDYSEETLLELEDTKEYLLDLHEFANSVKEYTDGVSKASDTSTELSEGVAEITEKNTNLNEKIEQIFQSMLLQSGELLNTKGIEIDLSDDRYVEQLDELLRTEGPYDRDVRETLYSLKERLGAIDAYIGVVESYTESVSLASENTQEFSEEMEELSSAGTPLDEEADTIFETMLEMVNRQLEAKGIEADITEENFQTEIDSLMEVNVPEDSNLTENLEYTKEMLLAVQEFRGSVQEYTDAVYMVADGSSEFVDGVKELQEEADNMLEEYFTFSIDNLTSFVPREDNPRIGASINDVMINKVAGMVAGVIVMILFTYVISVFVVHSIEQESSVIGALYALGVKRGQLLLHYLVLPVVITFLGGIVGCLIGFSPIGVDSQASEVVSYFSLPVLERVYPLYLLLYSLVMPPLVATVVNCMVISKKLNRTALSLMRREEKAGKIKEMKLGRIGFVWRFQIRQLLRELRSTVAVVGGMFICLLVLMIGVNCYVLCENFRKSSVEETQYEYLYSYKYPTAEVPEGGTEGYMESLKKEAFGYNLEVGILGLTEENPYFDVTVSKKKNEIVISSAVASKFAVKEGEKLVLTDDVNDRDYAFTIVDVVPYNSSLYVFMDIGAMREVFEKEEDYYNIVFAEEPLEIESGRLYATTSKANIEEASEIFAEMMWPMITMMVVVSAIVFIVVMYLMMKVMIDRSAGAISLMKVFGYRKSEVRKLYLDGNFVVVAIGALVCLPLVKKVMDAIYPYFISNVAIGLDVAFGWELYVGIYVAIIVLYLVINQLLVRRLEKVDMAEILKNRE